MISFKSREIHGETINVDQKEVYFFGPDLTLRGCTVVLSVSDSNLILAPSRFIDCRIVAKRKMSNVRWHNVFFSGCRFSGSFEGCEFGQAEDFDAGGGLTDCDFSEANLDACGFHNVDVGTVNFPTWPCFTVTDPSAHADALLAAPWPGLSRVVGETLAECEPEFTAVTYSATGIAKRYKVDEADLRVAVEKIPGAHF